MKIMCGQGKRFFTQLMIGVCALALSQIFAPSSLAGIDNWMQFGNQPGGSWEQPFDHTFVRQWESQPRRGYPTLSQKNIPVMHAAIKRYARIVAAGGWPRLPNVKLRTGMSHQVVRILRRRLEISGDLEQSSGFQDTFDYYVEKALKRAQMRNGLTPTGILDDATIGALNVPASARLRQLRTNLTRLKKLAASTSAKQRYVLVNLPAAQIEAVKNDQVVSRHAAVVGKPSRPSPILQSTIYEINFNKEWILPPTVIQKDLIPKGQRLSRKGEDVLRDYGIDVYADYEAYRRGQKLNPRRINWSSPDASKYFYAQPPGKGNPLGFVKINFGNNYSVYMHDTPSKTLFGHNYRAESSGCIRVQGIEQLVTWLLRDTPGWNLHRVGMMKRSGEQLNVRLKKAVPLYFAYVTAWATPDGLIQFRRDLYGRDGVSAAASY